MSESENLIEQATTAMMHYEYAFAKNETEKFMWIFADNYLEMAKGRLYGQDQKLRQAAQFTLTSVLLIILKLFAPFMPHVTEQIYLDLFSKVEGSPSIHRSPWPHNNPVYYHRQYLELGDVLIAIASAIRRYKSEKGLSLGTKLNQLEIKLADPDLQTLLKGALPDLMSISRAEMIKIVETLNPDLEKLELEDWEMDMAISLVGPE
ncbi:MAG: class I tRNA ligase family protein [Anaerolineales bacterium]